METLQAGAAIRKCLEAEEVLGIIRMGMEIQTTTTTLFEFTPENYVTSEQIIHLKRRGKNHTQMAKMARGVLQLLQ